MLTYQQKLDELLQHCDLKVQAFIEAINDEPHSARAAHLKTEWEAAETAYMSCSNFVRSGKVELHDFAIY